MVCFSSSVNLLRTHSEHPGGPGRWLGPFEIAEGERASERRLRPGQAPSPSERSRSVSICWIASRTPVSKRDRSSLFDGAIKARAIPVSSCPSSPSSGSFWSSRLPQTSSLENRRVRFGPKHPFVASEVLRSRSRWLVNRSELGRSLRSGGGVGPHSLRETIPCLAAIWSRLRISVKLVLDTVKAFHATWCCHACSKPEERSKNFRSAQRAIIPRGCGGWINRLPPSIDLNGNRTAACSGSAVPCWWSCRRPGSPR